MHFLPANRLHVTSVLRGVLATIFIVWLLLVLFQYYKPVTLPKKPITEKQTSQQVLVKQVSLPPLPKQNSASAVIPTVKTPTKSPTKPEQSEKLTEMPKPQKTPTANRAETVEQVYQQLTKEGVDIQIAWPQDANKRQAALHFMYQCVGVQLAALNGNQITKLNQTKVNDYSDWVRVAQGRLSYEEQNWINAYSVTGTIIRLFPRSLDWRLSQYLANTLQGSPLKSLRASYQINHQGLFLRDIWLNKQPITDTWLIYKKQC